MSGYWEKLPSTFQNAHEEKEENISDVTQSCICECCQKNHCNSEEASSVESICRKVLGFLSTSDRYKNQDLKETKIPQNVYKDHKESMRNHAKEQERNACTEIDMKSLEISIPKQEFEPEITNSENISKLNTLDEYYNGQDNDKSESIDVQENKIHSSSEIFSKCKPMSSETASNISLKSFNNKSETKIILQESDNIQKVPPYFKCIFQNAPINCVFQQIICNPESEPVIVNECRKHHNSNSLNSDQVREETKFYAINGNSSENSNDENKLGNQPNNTKMDKCQASLKSQCSQTNVNKLTIDSKRSNVPNSGELKYNENSKLVDIYNILNRLKSILNQNISEIGRKFYATMSNFNKLGEEESCCCKRSRSEIIRITDIIPLGRRCLLVQWKVLTSKTCLSYEVSLDGCLVSRLTSSQRCVSDIICGVDIGAKHIICVTPISTHFCNNAKSRFCHNCSFPMYEKVKCTKSYYEYNPT